MRRRKGLSLLEVLLALAILGATLAIINELMRVGGRNAEQARDVTTAQIHCESLMAQVVCGLIAPTPVVNIPIDDPNQPGEWLYSLTVEQIDQNGMLAVQLTVTQNPELIVRPVSFGAMRWMLDPETTGTSDSSTSSSTTSSTSSE
jgi:general secretion pathway protein I